MQRRPEEEALDTRGNAIPKKRSARPVATGACNREKDNSWCGEYSIGPGGGARLVRYRGRDDDDFDPVAALSPHAHHHEEQERKKHKQVKSEDEVTTRGQKSRELGCLRSRSTACTEEAH